MLDRQSSYSFGKSLRLLDAKAYKSVFDDAIYKVSRREILLLARPNDKATPRLGLVIAKKNAKHATQRNRIKRIARESFRLQQDQMHGVDAVVLARRGLDALDNIALHKMFDRLWQQLRYKSENNTSKTVGQ